MITKKGIITSAKMQGTVAVTVHRYEMHPIYRKRFRKSKKFLADTAGMKLSEGDLVLIAQCRPISKRKYFKVVEVLQKAPETAELAEEQSVLEALAPGHVATEKPSSSSR